MPSKNYTELEVTDEEFKEIVNNSHKVVVVDFFAEWCMPCLMMSPVIDELSSNLDEIKFVKVNIDDNPRLAEKSNVYSIPCIVIFKEGKEIERIIGTQTYEVIEEKVKRHLN
ncbi:thioredoxin [Candidatus Pacearchaeota archaeon]|nr:thioredoxin [Candidatus Pacearchaeota archaeon]MBD3283715.1 thioredoxin [Candidatus Pacearchaeota archaeon]